MIRKIVLTFCIGLWLFNCDSDDSNAINTSQSAPIFTFTHHWNGTPVSSTDFNNFSFTTENGEIISIERLRYLISDITFTGSVGENLNTNAYNLIDVTNNNGLSYTLETTVPTAIYSNVSFTFGFDNQDNSGNYLDLNSANFNVPDMLGGGYHYMQFDGEYLDSNNDEQPFNYHAIRAVDASDPNNLVFPQNTFFSVNLGEITVTPTAEIQIEVNLAEWFRNPNQWDLNVLNTVLMPNTSAQVMMFENGQSVFSLGEVIYNTDE